MQFGLVMLCGLLACSNHEVPQAGHYWLDQEVSQKLQSPTEVVGVTRPALRFDNGISVTNCEGYLQQDSAVSESNANFSAHSNYLICDALEQAKTWPISRNMKPFDQSLSLCSRVDLASFRHSLRPRIEATPVTLSDLFGAGASERANSCVFDGEGRNFVLTPILLVSKASEPSRLWIWVTDEILETSYRTYTPVWFVFDQKTDRWVAEK